MPLGTMYVTCLRIEWVPELTANSTHGLPIGLVIDKVVMNKRGQMGIYWNSVNHFTSA